jgi:hypothetical protein
MTSIGGWIDPIGHGTLIGFAVRLAQGCQIDDR